MIGLLYPAFDVNQSLHWICGVLEISPPPRLHPDLEFDARNWAVSYGWMWCGDPSALWVLTVEVSAAQAAQEV